MTTYQPPTHQQFSEVQPIQPPAPQARKPRNTIGIVALAASIMGFIFAVMEGAYLLGWILLPIAFVLSLVALFQRAPKKTAVAALIITIVGTISGAVAFMGSVARAFESAGGGSVSAAPIAGGSSASDQKAAPQGAAQQGTRENPYPAGATVSNENWQVTINSYQADATKNVLAANQFNDKPEAGHQYSLANITVTNLADEAASPMFEVRVSYVTAQGNVVERGDALVVAPKALSDNELYKGASATGNVALQTPQGDDGLLRLTIGFISGDEVFFATK